VSAPDLVVVGHVVQDLVPGGWRLGGTATFASVQAERLGLRVGVVTRTSTDLALNDLLPGIEIVGRPSTCTTAFENLYEGNLRRQRVPLLAESLETEDVPESWRTAPIVLLGPVCGEVPAEMGALFPRSLVGAAAQGWLRQLDEEGRVQMRTWSGPPFWSGCRAVFVSDEDLGQRRDQLDRWADEVPLVALTRDWRGAKLHTHGRWQQIEAFPAQEVDPTGAGDVFAAAFLVRYHETEDAAEAARFASAAAACSVEAAGIEAIVGRREIEARMEKHPEVVLR